MGMTSAITMSKTSDKSTCSSWLRYFNEGEGSQSGLVWRPYFIFVVMVHAFECARGWLEHLCVSLDILFTKGEKLALALIYLGPLFLRLDGCVANTEHSVGRCDVVTHANMSFLQMFLWE